MKRIGIYSGTFNPVHSGHLSFALQAFDEARLDKLYFMPERYRKDKQDVAHYGHRVAMIKQAIKPYSRLGLIESVDVSFTIDRTLPRLRGQFKHSELIFLFGSDSLVNMPQWPNIEQLLKTSGLMVGIRSNNSVDVETSINKLPAMPKELYVIQSFAPGVSSTKVREALRLSKDAEGILSSVRNYSNRNWLYISLA